MPEAKHTNVYEAQQTSITNIARENSVVYNYKQNLFKKKLATYLQPKKAT